jgi:protein TonB
MPSFPGGDLKLSEFLFQTVIYPDSARVLSTEGTVVVEFVVNEDGTIANPRIASKKMLGHGLEKEAIRVISKMPKWVPGSQDGKAVRVRYRLPLRFKLMN